MGSSTRTMQTSPRLEAGFGPVVVPLQDFKKLAKVKIQFFLGDYRTKNDTWLTQCRRAVHLISLYEGGASMLFPAEEAGLKGSTHSGMADTGNEKVANLLSEFLGRKNRSVRGVEVALTRGKLKFCNYFSSISTILLIQQDRQNYFKSLHTRVFLRSPW